MNNRRKILALVLSLIMILALIPSAYAEKTSTGEAEEPETAKEITDTSECEIDMSSVNSTSTDKPDPMIIDFGGEDGYTEQIDPAFDSYSIYGCTPADSDKDDYSAFAENPEKKSEVEETADLEPKGDVYSGTCSMFYTDFSIGTAGSTVYKSFNAPYTATYRIWTTISDDTKGYLRDNGKNLLAQNDDGGYGRNFLIEYSMTAGTNYYVGAQFFDSSKTGNIRVFFEIVTTGSSISQGYSNFSISSPGRVMYRKFTPSVTGHYAFYSLTDKDTWGYLADADMHVFKVNDDAGYNTNFGFSADLEAGTDYYIGARFHDTTQTGTIRVFIERQVVNDTPLSMGSNWTSISTAGTTVYRTFTAPKNGVYYVYSAQPYGQSTLADTLVVLADSDRKVYAYDNDGGYGNCFKLEVNLSSGDVVYFGTRFTNTNKAGSIPIIIDYYYTSDTTLGVGYNKLNVPYASTVQYYPFTPSVTDTYTVYSYGSDDTEGLLLDENKCCILFDDDSGYDLNFKISCELTAGTKYYIAGRFHDNEKDGDIKIMIERQKVETNELKMGRNTFSVDAGKTVYMKFTAPYSGTYWIYSVNKYGEDSIPDTLGVLADGDVRVRATNDDGGYGRCFRFVISSVSAGNEIYIGVRYLSSATSGNVPVFIDFPKVNESAYNDGVTDMGYTNIEQAGKVHYYAFTPAVTGTYTVYSCETDSYHLTPAGDSDTIGMLLDANKKAILFDDDSGLNNTHFKYTYEMQAGTKYYVGVRFYNQTATGNIFFSIERQIVKTDASLNLGKNFVNITDGGTTVYTKFVAPFNGYYHIYTAQEYGNTHMPDLYGMVANADMHVCCFEDAIQSKFNLTVHDLKAGDVIYVGVRYDSITETGYIPVIIDYPLSVGTELQIGDNTVNVLGPDYTMYYHFTAPYDATFDICSTGNDDTFSAIFDEYNNPVVFSDDIGSGDRNFAYSCLIGQGETYTIAVRFYSHTQTGDINIRISHSPFSEYHGNVYFNSEDVMYKGTTPYVIANGSPQTPRVYLYSPENDESVDPACYTVEYKENINAGTAYVFIHFLYNYSGTLTKAFKIYLPATTSTTVANTKDGIKVAWAAVPGADGYVIYRRAWNLVDAGWTDFVRWNNTTALTWTDTKVYAGTRYQYGIKAYFNKRLDPISGTEIGGNVGDSFNLGMVGPLKTTVRITTRELKSVTAGSKKLTAKWAGSSVFTGYQLQIATDSKFTANKQTFKITDPKTVQKVVTGLNSNTTYYVRVRSYHVFEGMTYYGGWSNVLNCKVK